MKKIGTLILSVLLSITLMTPMSVQAESVNDLDIIAENLELYLVGNKSINNDSAAKAKVAAIYKAGLANIPNLDKDKNYVYEKNVLDNSLDGSLTNAALSANLETTYKNFYAVALALTTPGDANPLYQDIAAYDALVESMLWVHSTYLKDTDKGYYGNWYSWEIGVPMNLSKILFLFKDRFEPSFITESITMMDAYIRGDEVLGSDLIGDVILDARQHTGANLTDITFNRIIQGVLLKDEQRVAKAVSDSMTVFKTIDPNNLEHGVTDGFYEDGSFIQHSTVAYTGSYGKVLLQRIAQLVMALDRTKWQDDTLMETVQEWVYRGFAPVMYEGYMMEIVKGRATSRTATGYADTAGVIEPLIQLSLGMQSEDKLKLQSYVKYLENIPQIAARKSVGSFIAISNIFAYNSIMNDASIPSENPIEQNEHYAFNLMDKTVHLRDTFGFSIGKSSNRVSKYEYMSGENLKSWFHGDGAFYLYQSGVDQNQSYGIDFFSTIDSYKLPGITTVNEKRQTIPEAHGKDFYENGTDFSSGSILQNKYVYFPLGTNSFSGGAKLGSYGVSSMQLGDEQSYADRNELPEDFITYKNAEANKSWFMFDDEIVVLGSNIHDINNREMTSTIDNRMYASDEHLTVNSNLDTALSGEVEHLKWLSLELDNPDKNISYVFHDQNNVNINEEVRTGKYSDVRNKTTGTADKTITKKYLTLTYNHDGTTKDSYAYSIVPKTNGEQVQKYINDNTIEILKNTDAVHAVSHKGLGIKAYTFFGGKNEAGDISSSDPLIMIRQDQTFSVQDPLHTQAHVSFTVEGTFDVASGDATSTVENGKTTVRVNTENKNGVSQIVTLETKTIEETQDRTLVDAKTGISFTFANDTFPQDVVVEVTELKNTAPEGYTRILNYDISFKSSNTELQPKGAVVVKIPQPENKKEAVFTFHKINDIYTLIESKTIDGVIEFSTESFSEYLFASKNTATEPETPENGGTDVPGNGGIEKPGEAPGNGGTEKPSPEAGKLPGTGIAPTPILMVGAFLIIVGFLMLRRRKRFRISEHKAN